MSTKPVSRVPAHVAAAVGLALILLVGVAPGAAAVDPSAGPPRISSQPQDQYVQAGGTATFSVSTDDEAGRQTATVRHWEVTRDFRTWEPLPDTYGVMTITVPALAEGSRCVAYRARVFGRGFSRTTRAATLCPIEAPTVRIQPDDQVRRDGETVVLRAIGDGLPIPTATWWRVDTASDTYEPVETTPWVTGSRGPFSGFVVDNEDRGESRLLFTFDPERDDNVTFMAIFENAGGRDFSRHALVTHRSLDPVIDDEPEDQTRSEGERAYFEVGWSAYSTDSDDVTVQWYRSTDGGESFSAIDGAVHYFYYSPPLTAENDGDLYEAVVTDTATEGSSSAQSRQARVTVEPAGFAAASTSPQQDDKGIGLLAPLVAGVALLGAAAALLVVRFRHRAPALS